MALVKSEAVESILINESYIFTNFNNTLRIYWKYTTHKMAHKFC